MTALVWRGTCLRMRPGKGSFSARGVLAGGETGPFRRRCEDRGPKPAETLAASGRPAYTGAGSGESKRKSGLKGLSSTERAKALIGLAHPKFRDELTEAATKMFLI
jgi:hypothetical protein